MPRSERLDWVDTGRGIAILLVALFHTTNWMAGTGLDVALWGDLNVVLSSLRMPLFFALSGLFAAKWLTSTWRDLLATKVLLFLWVLVVWSVIGMVIQQAGLRAAGQEINIFAAIRRIFVSPLDPPFELWFIWALALFFVVAKATRRAPIVAQLAVAGVMSAAALTVWLNLTTGLTGSAKFYFFFLGGLYARAGILKFASSRAWVLALVFVAWGAGSWALFALDLRGLPVVYFVNCVVGVLAGVSLSRALHGLTVLRRLGRQTLPIYLAHTPIVIAISILFFAWPQLLLVAEPVSLLIPPIVAGIAVVGALALHKVNALRYLYQPAPIAVRLIAAKR